MASSQKSIHSPIYCIKVQGVLAPRWSDWFDGLSIQSTGRDATLLVGPLTDQAALHGVLMKIRDLGLTLLSVELQDTTSDPQRKDG